MSAGGSLLGGSGYPRRRARPADGVENSSAALNESTPLKVERQEGVDYHHNVTLPIGVPNMTTTIELLDAAKRAAGCESDYAFGKRFGFSGSLISNWRHGRNTFDDNSSEVIAGILGREPGEVMAICQAQRAKDDKSRSRWLRVAALLAASVLPPAAGAASHNTSHNFQSNQDSIGIMSTRLRHLLRAFLVGDWLRLA